MQLLAAMAPPGGGRNAFSQRVQACFATLNVTAPNDLQLKRIFGTILNAKVGARPATHVQHLHACRPLAIISGGHVCVRLHSATFAPACTGTHGVHVPT